MQNTQVQMGNDIKDTLKGIGRL